MKSLLVLDYVTTQNTSKIKDKIKKCKTALSVIPSGLAQRLHSLDISFNKVFKESLRNRYVCYWISKNNIQISKSAITEWIDELWYSNYVITNKIRFNSI